MHVCCGALQVAVARALGLPKGGAQVEPASEAGQALRAEPPPLVDPDAAPITLTVSSALGGGTEFSSGLCHSPPLKGCQTTCIIDRPSFDTSTLGSRAQAKVSGGERCKNHARAW